MPTMKSGDILRHEFMGEVIETGSAHNKFRKGDRIVVPFNINCGECRQCKLGNYSVCQRSNRNAAVAGPRSSATRRQASSDIPTSPAATRAARPNMCACRWPMSRP
jgi:threonine dehydrogenase-like Zn-dependent dehydrogenase